MSYTLRTVLKSIYREKWVNLLSVASIASSFFILLIIFLLVYNFHLATNRLPELFSVVVYLKDNISQEDVEKINNQLKERTEISEIRFFSKAQALQEFEKTVKGAAIILEGLDENPLSPYMEVKLKKEIVSMDAVSKISEDIKKIQGVDDVYFGEKIVETIYLLKKSSQIIGIFLFLTVSIVVVFISYSTVKILFYRKKNEIEILKLLGATNGFIRAPFLIEGVILGTVGGIFGASFTGILYFSFKYQFATIIPIVEGLVLPWQVIPLSVVLCSFLGAVGSIIAIGRIRV
ncbi:MAG: ABC transporter permease [Thermodesulfovibrionales bacterium]|nr:ABC transporter permease [Thermodesulfovibrionales bacterium]